jgi:hypothetical protein
MLEMDIPYPSFCPHWPWVLDWSVRAFFFASGLQLGSLALVIKECVLNITVKQLAIIVAILLVLAAGLMLEAYRYFPYLP